MERQILRLLAGSEVDFQLCA